MSTDDSIRRKELTSFTTRLQNEASSQPPDAANGAGGAQRSGKDNAGRCGGQKDTRTAPEGSDSTTRNVCDAAEAPSETTRNCTAKDDMSGLGEMLLSTGAESLVPKELAASQRANSSSGSHPGPNLRCSSHPKTASLPEQNQNPSQRRAGDLRRIPGHSEQNSTVYSRHASSSSEPSSEAQRSEQDIQPTGDKYEDDDGAPRRHPSQVATRPLPLEALTGKLLATEPGINSLTACCSVAAKASRTLSSPLTSLSSPGPSYLLDSGLKLVQPTEGGGAATAELQSSSIAEQQLLAAYRECFLLLAAAERQEDLFIFEFVLSGNRRQTELWRSCGRRETRSNSGETEATATCCQFAALHKEGNRDLSRPVVPFEVSDCNYTPVTKRSCLREETSERKEVTASCEGGRPAQAGTKRHDNSASFVPAPHREAKELTCSFAGQITAVGPTPVAEHAPSGVRLRTGHEDIGGRGEQTGLLPNNETVGFEKASASKRLGEKHFCHDPTGYRKSLSAETRELPQKDHSNEKPVSNTDAIYVRMGADGKQPFRKHSQDCQNVQHDLTSPFGEKKDAMITHNAARSTLRRKECKKGKRANLAVGPRTWSARTLHFVLAALDGLRDAWREGSNNSEAKEHILDAVLLPLCVQQRWDSARNRAHRHQQLQQQLLLGLQLLSPG
ncbi:ap2 domain transcription factor ap2x-10, partial [Cystoisospora suis]